ncbi:SDR family oxidoreductase [Chryseobacterium sp. RG1]|uniref:SDR family oxidoreductase n=1 Tax=Chryseobacterium tagetis TaxID=2801334 RepID=A0ABS8A4T2_9FLAO|nr:SDR family oxidoreductase [Chryseobacterium tagetis]MCA6067726.1 SDR family oxidoreductase [Chryseobacterium tagetis]
MNNFANNKIEMNKTILITGTSTGLGRLAAKHFAEKGWNVIATMRSPEKEDELNSIANIKVLKLDITEPQTIQQAIMDGIDTFGKIDVVVNNAGIGMYGALELTADEDIDRQYAVNVRGPINVIKSFLPYFREQRGGKFINVSSVMGRSTALPLGSLYNMSKFALEGLTEGLYFELKPLNIELHLVEPGGFESNFGNNITFSKSETIRDYDLITSNVGAVLNAVNKPGATASPLSIVKTVYNLASGKNNSFRTVVGKDAKSVLMLRKILPIKIFLNLLSKRFIN